MIIGGEMAEIRHGGGARTVAKKAIFGVVRCGFGLGTFFRSETSAGISSSAGIFRL